MSIWGRLYPWEEVRHRATRVDWNAWVRRVFEVAALLHTSPSQGRIWEEFVDLSLTHLESRCVLNGAPPVAVSAETPGVSTENALQSSHDQHADVLRLEREGEGTQLTNANDSPPSERIAGLYSRPLNGSGANHRMFADVRQEKRLSNAGPPLESAVQASVAGESLVIRGGVAQSVSYSIGAHGGSVNIDGVVIAFDATMAVSDNLQASHREFIIDGDRANLGLSEVSGGYLSLSDSTRFANIAFPYPAESLSIQTRNTERSNDQEFTVVSVEGDTFDVGMLNSRGIQISIAARNSDFHQHSRRCAPRRGRLFCHCRHHPHRSARLKCEWLHRF